MPKIASPILTEERRRELFLALVTAQDEGDDPAASRKAVAKTYGLTVAQVKAVEQEGLDSEWPPL